MSPENMRSGGSGIGFDDPAAIGVGIKHGCLCYRLQIAGAGNCLSPSLGRIQRRQQHPGKDRDDGDHDK